MASIHRVWVGGLPTKVTDEELEECFADCGEISEIQVKHGKTDTFAFISFTDRRGYEKAKEMNQNRFFGNPIKVNDVINREERNQDDPPWSSKGKGGGGSSKGAPWRSRDDRGDNREERSHGYRDDNYDADRSKGDRGRGGYERDRGYDRDYDRGGYDRGSGSDRNAYDRDRGDGYRERERNRDERDRDRAYESRGNDRSRSRDRGGDLARRGKGSEAENEKRVWVGGLPKDISEEEIEKVFSQCGRVSGVLIRSSQRDVFAFVQYGSVANAQNAIETLDQSTELGPPMKVARASGVPKDFPKEKARGKGKGHDDDYGGGDRGGRDHGGDYGGGDRGGRDHGGRDRGGRSRERSGSSVPRRRKRSPTPPRRRTTRSRVALEGLPADMDKDELMDLSMDYGQVVDGDIWRDGGITHAWVEFGSKSETMAAIEALHDRRVQGWNQRIKAFLEEKSA